MRPDVVTTTVADGIAVITLGSARRIYMDDEMGVALTGALDGFAGDAKVRAKLKPAEIETNFDLGHHSFREPEDRGGKPACQC